MRAGSYEALKKNPSKNTSVLVITTAVVTICAVVVYAIVDTQRFHKIISQDIERVSNKVAQYQEQNKNDLNACLNFKGNCCSVTVLYTNTHMSNGRENISSFSMPCGSIPNLLILDSSMSIVLHSVNLNEDIRRGW